MEATQNNQEQRPCRKCVDFYGTANTNFLCSKCYRENAKDEQAVEVQNAAVERAQEELFAQLPVQQPAQVPAQIVPAPQLVEEAKQEDVAMEEAASTEVQVAAAEQTAPVEEAKEEQPAIQTNTNKCWTCEKKVGILKVPCKCTYVYCAKHRHAEAHDCKFDYFAQNQARLEKLNPQISHQKMVDRV